jgi:hypothetical protein
MTKKLDNKHGTQLAEPKHSLPEPLQAEIQQLAYQLYCECSYEHGHDSEHWAEAERQVLERHHGKRATAKG